jgi:hypothetical protein
MNEVEAGDVIFSFVSQRIRAVGVAKGPSFASPRPIDFEETEAWEQEESESTLRSKA